MQGPTDTPGILGDGSLAPNPMGSNRSGWEAKFGPTRSPTDPRYQTLDRSLMDRACASFDEDYVGIGSSPYNDPASSRIMVPAGAVPSGGTRWLLRLATEVVGYYEVKRLRGIRQAVGIGELIVGTDPEAPSLYVAEVDQTSPFWHFSDGNISWHLRILRAPTTGVRGTRPTLPGLQPDYTGGTDTVRLVDVNPALNAPARGIPPGWPLGPLGTWRDLRWPWVGHGAMDSIDITIAGPAVIALYASVKQTDPQTRQTRVFTDAQAATLPPEEQFIRQFPNARYRHVSGALIVETMQQHRRVGYDPRQGETPEV